MWYGSKYSMAVQAEMLCLFSRSLPPVLSCDRFSTDFQQWETSVEQLMLNALLTAWLSPKVKRGSPYHPTVMTELLVCFPSAFFFSVLKMQSSLGVSTTTAFRHAFISFSRNTSFYIPHASVLLGETKGEAARKVCLCCTCKKNITALHHWTQRALSAVMKVGQSPVKYTPALSMVLKRKNSSTARMISSNTYLRYPWCWH